MAMGSSALVLFFFPIFFHLLVPTPAQTNLLVKICSKNGNFTTNSDYKSNLNHLTSSFSSNTEIDYGFYNGSYGRNTDKVNAISLCRGDKKPETCRSCIRNSSQVLSQLCPHQKEAYIWYDDCMLRYSNRSIFGNMEFGPYFWMYNLNNVTDVNEFNATLNFLLGNLTDSAASGDSRRKFAVGNTTTKNSQQTVYAMVQCTPDLSQQECSKCLNQAIELIPKCCSGRQGGRVVTPSCHFRYEKDPFYDLAAVTLPPAPAPLPISTPIPPQAIPAAVVPPVPAQATPRVASSTSRIVNVLFGRVQFPIATVLLLFY